MRVKDAYSLRTDELLEAVPIAENLPSRYDDAINLDIVRQHCAGSLNIFTTVATPRRLKNFATTGNVVSARSPHKLKCRNFIVPCRN